MRDIQYTKLMSYICCLYTFNILHFILLQHIEYRNNLMNEPVNTNTETFPHLPPHTQASHASAMNRLNIETNTKSHYSNCIILQHCVDCALYVNSTLSILSTYCSMSPYSESPKLAQHINSYD